MRNLLNGDGDLSALLSTTGAPVRPDVDGDVTLVAGTYYFPLENLDATYQSISIRTDATIVATFTFETCDFASVRTNGGGRVQDHDTVAGNWVPFDPPSGTYVATVGTGWVITNLSLAKTAGLGGANVQLGNMAARRIRVKAVVATGGKCRVGSCGKS